MCSCFEFMKFQTAEQKKLKFQEEVKEMNEGGLQIAVPEGKEKVAEILKELSFLKMLNSKDEKAEDEKAKITEQELKWIRWAITDRDGNVIKVLLQLLAKVSYCESRRRVVSRTVRGSKILEL